MGDYLDEICSATLPTIEGRYTIPYDVDFLWNDGCDGSDWWEDDAGDSVEMIVSDTGSAYICPKKSDAFWRIYVDRWGQAWELERWPRPKSDIYEVSDASQELAEILECAGVRVDEAAQKFKICSIHDSNQSVHNMQLGLEVALPETFSIYGANDWKVTFVEGGIIFRNWTNEESFTVDSVPIVSNPYEEPELDDEWADWADNHNHVDIDLMEATDAERLAPFISALLATAEDTVGLEHGVMEMAAMVIDRACRTKYEIEAFEKACYQ
jgi:hypothetical protein